jgi:putative FmdB family regulatory protein
MPIYEYKCFSDGEVIEKLQKLSGDDIPPKCPTCGIEMSKVFSPVFSIFKGRDQSVRVSKQLKKRSEDQGKKFFRRYPEHQELVIKTLKEKEI